MRARRLAALSVAAASAALAAVGIGNPSGAGADDAYTVSTLHFLTHIGPDGTQACDVVGDLYLPDAASATSPVPAILTTNGFGGSKDDQAGLGKAFAQRGFAVLSYSGLGFGGSDCKITLDDPDYDGRAASQLISYLGGASGIAFTDAGHTTPAPVLTSIVHDARDHRGRAQAHDPRVGMIGGSYGGGIQFATASVDPRLDTIVPLITWNNLAYSLGPNNAAGSTTPGTTKLTWGLGFSAEGVLDGLENAQGDPSRLYGCPNFADFVCPALVTAGSTGYFQPDAIAAFEHASVASFVKRVTIPTLLIQGENDTLFNLNESVATYRALRHQRTPVQMIWQSWGHSGATPAPGEISLSDPDPATQYETARIAAWFDRYLRDADVDTGPAFSYFRDWIDYSGIATPAYGTSGSFPVGTRRTLYLSGASALVGARKQATHDAQSFVTPPAGAPTSLNPVDVIGSFTTGVPQADLPGTFATWTGAPLAAPLDVVGSPVARLRVQAPAAAATQGAGPAGQLVLFVKVLDVAPDGSASLIHGLEAPVRVADVGKPVTVTLPGIVHRFAAGHSIRLVVAGGSDNYRAGVTPTPVTIAGGAGQQLMLPTVGG